MSFSLLLNLSKSFKRHLLKSVIGWLRLRLRATNIRHINKVLIRSDFFLKLSLGSFELFLEGVLLINYLLKGGVSCLE